MGIGHSVAVAKGKQSTPAEKCSATPTVWTQQSSSTLAKPKPGAHLTIRSSRDRFAASLVAVSCTTPLGRCASRLNSGVRFAKSKSWRLNESRAISPRSDRVVATPGTSSDRSGGGRRLKGGRRTPLRFEQISGFFKIARHLTFRKSNYSFKPRPLRGSANAVSCTTSPSRCAVRLNSGVRFAKSKSAQLNDQMLIRADLLVSSLRQARLRKSQAAAGG